MKKFSKVMGTTIFTLTMVASLSGNGLTTVWATETGSSDNGTVVDTSKQESNETDDEATKEVTYYLAVNEGNSTSYKKLGTASTDAELVAGKNSSKVLNMVSQLVPTASLEKAIDKYTKYVELKDGSVVCDDLYNPIKCQWFKEYEVASESDGWRVYGHLVDEDGKEIKSEKTVVFVDEDNLYIGKQKTTGGKIGTITVKPYNTKNFSGWVNEKNNSAVTKNTVVSGDYMVLKASYKTANKTVTKTPAKTSTKKKTKTTTKKTTKKTAKYVSVTAYSAPVVDNVKDGDCVTYTNKTSLTNKFKMFNKVNKTFVNNVEKLNYIAVRNAIKMDLTISHTDNKL